MKQQEFEAEKSSVGDYIVMILAFLVMIGMVVGIVTYSGQEAQTIQPPSPVEFAEFTVGDGFSVYGTDEEKNGRILILGVPVGTSTNQLYWINPTLFTDIEGNKITFIKGRVYKVYSGNKETGYKLISP